MWQNYYMVLGSTTAYKATTTVNQTKQAAAGGKKIYRVKEFSTKAGSGADSAPTQLPLQSRILRDCCERSF